MQQFWHRCNYCSTPLFKQPRLEACWRMVRSTCETVTHCWCNYTRKSLWLQCQLLYWRLREEQRMLNECAVLQTSHCECVQNHEENVSGTWVLPLLARNCFVTVTAARFSQIQIWQARRACLKLGQFLIEFKKKRNHLSTNTCATSSCAWALLCAVRGEYWWPSCCCLTATRGSRVVASFIHY